MLIYMQIREGEVLPINVELTDTLGDLKMKSEGFHRVPVSQQLLVFAGKPMIDDTLTLGHYNLEFGSKVYLVLKVRGCSNCEHCNNNKNT